MTSSDATVDLGLIRKEWAALRLFLSGFSIMFGDFLEGKRMTLPDELDQVCREGSQGDVFANVMDSVENVLSEAIEHVPSGQVTYQTTRQGTQEILFLHLTQEECRSAAGRRPVRLHRLVRHPRPRVGPHRTAGRTRRALFP